MRAPGEARSPGRAGRSRPPARPPPARPASPRPGCRPAARPRPPSTSTAPPSSPSPTSAATWAASLAPSPRMGSQPRDSTSGMSGPSAVGTRETTPARGRRRAAGRRARAAVGARRRASRPQVEARASARAASSSSSSPARSRTRRGSTSTTRASSPSRSQTSSSESASHGSHDSMPSNWSPSARRSHWWRPHGLRCPPGRPPAPAWPRRSTSSRQPNSSTAPEVVDRALVGHVEPGQPVDLVAPQVDAHRLVGRGGEDVDDPAPHGQLAAVLDDATRAGSPWPPARATSSSTSTRSPLATTTGRAAVRNGPSRCSTALMGATTMSGPGRRPPSAPGPPAPPSCHSSRSRWPMVATSGLTRSKGRVSQAGKTSTLPRAASRGEGVEVVGQLLGRGPGGGHHQHRATGAQPDQAGQHEGLGRGGHGQGGVGRADDPRHGGLVAQQGRKRAEAHPLRVPGTASEPLGCGTVGLTAQRICRMESPVPQVASAVQTVASNRRPRARHSRSPSESPLPAAPVGDAAHLVEAARPRH